MRRVASTTVLLFAVLVLSACTASTSHHQARVQILQGFIGAAVLFCFAWIAGYGDDSGGGSGCLAVIFGLVGVGFVVWGLGGVINLFKTEPKLGHGEYTCYINTDDSLVITAHNVGTNLLIIDTVNVDLLNTRGRRQTDPASVSLTTLGAAKIKPGATQEYVVNDPAPEAVVPRPARCKVIGVTGEPG